MARITSVPCDGETTTYVSPPKLRVARALARLPRLGDTVGLMLDPTFYLFEKYLRHGPVFTVKMPYQTYTVLAGSEAATFMSSKDGRECLTVGSSWRFVEEQFGGKDSLVAVDGPQHKQWRTLLQRGYSREAIADRYSEAIDVIDDAVDKHWRPGESVPVLSAMQKLSIAQVGTFLGGVRPTDDDIEDIALVTREILKIAPVQHIPKFMLQLPRYVNARSRVARVAQNASRSRTLECEWSPRAVHAAGGHPRILPRRPQCGQPAQYAVPLGAALLRRSGNHLRDCDIRAIPHLEAPRCVVPDTGRGRRHVRTR